MNAIIYVTKPTVEKFDSIFFCFVFFLLLYSNVNFHLQFLLLLMLLWLQLTLWRFGAQIKAHTCNSHNEHKFFNQKLEETNTVKINCLILLWYCSVHLSPLPTQFINEYLFHQQIHFVWRFNWIEKNISELDL